MDVKRALILDLHDQKATIKAFYNCTEEQLEQKLDLLAASMGTNLFGKKAASLLMSLARPEDAIPSNLERFASLVYDGI